MACLLPYLYVERYTIFDGSFNNKTTNDEFRHSNSADALIDNSMQKYDDKLRTIANADEILKAAKKWIGEKKKHIRKDDIVEFARGKVSYKVGENGYAADVIVGIRKNGAAVLYDLVNICDKKIVEAPVTMASNNGSQRRQDVSTTDKVTRDWNKVKFSFSGERAVTADKSQLAHAKQMEENGADAERIRQETGWYRGYDNQWRFEVDDSESYLVDDPILQQHMDNDETYYTGKLADILKHEKLYEAYPTLKNTDIIIQETEPGISGISFNDSIVLSLELFRRYTQNYNEYLNGGRQAELNDTPFLAGHSTCLFLFVHFRHNACSPF